MKITAEQIYAAVPHAKPSLVADIVKYWDIAENNGIVSPRETGFFLGHVAVETAGLTRLEENLMYTTTARLRAVWPSRFKSDASAKPYVRNPVALANLVYGGRMGNEDNGTADNDGWDKRGSGLLQTTGADNFAQVEKVTGLPVTSQPDLLRTMPAALEAACIYWKANKIGALVDKPNAIEATTKAINGGTHGLADRTIYINRFLKIFAPTERGGVTHEPLRLGSKGVRVQALQVALQRLGMYDGDIDGDFGPATDNAVREYQETRNLHPVDGVVGPVTFARLEAEDDV